MSYFRSNRGRNGFTLVELLLVIAIMTAVGAIVFISATRVYFDTQVESEVIAAQSMKSGIHRYYSASKDYGGSDAFGGVPLPSLTSAVARAAGVASPDRYDATTGLRHVFNGPITILPASSLTVTGGVVMPPSFSIQYDQLGAKACIAMSAAMGRDFQKVYVGPSSGVTTVAALNGEYLPQDAVPACIAAGSGASLKVVSERPGRLAAAGFCPNATGYVGTVPGLAAPIPPFKPAINPTNTGYVVTYGSMAMDQRVFGMSFLKQAPMVGGVRTPSSRSGAIWDFDLVSSPVKITNLIDGSIYYTDPSFSRLMLADGTRVC